MKIFLPVFLFSSAIQAATPAAPLRPVIFEPGTNPHEFVSHAGQGFLRLSPAGADFALQGHPAVRLSLAGARQAAPRGEQLLPSTSSYFVGNDPNGWRTGVPNYARVRYDGVYEGVALVLHAAEDSLEYDFRVAPHADPSPIRLRFQGAAALRVNAEGDLVAGGWLVQRRPRVYQDLPQERREIAGRFRLHGDRTVSFDLGSYDASRELVIDPVIRYTSYLGGPGYDGASSIAVDASGNVYVGGSSVTANFPGTASFSRPTIGQYGFISKFAPIAGGKSQLLLTIFLGDVTPNAAGSGGTGVNGLAIDSSGNIVAAGFTGATHFPTLNAVQTQLSGTVTDCAIATGGAWYCPNGFVTKFAPNAQILVFSTYYGGNGASQFNDVAVDSEGGIYAAGNAAKTDSSGTANSVQPAAAGNNMTLVRLDPTGKLLYATHLGGTSTDKAYSVAVEKPGVVWIGGEARSTDMPTGAAGYQPQFAGFYKSAYLARIDTTKSGPAGLTYATYFNGASGNSLIAKVFLDPAGQVVFCGSAYSNLPVTATAMEGYVGVASSKVTGVDFAAGDGFIARINPALSGSAALTYSSYVGGSDYDTAQSCGLDPQGNFVVAGLTASFDPFVTSGSPLPMKTIGTGYNVYVIRIDPTKAGGRKESLLFGGEKSEALAAMAIDSNGKAYLAGSTDSHYFPVSPNAVQKQYGGDDPSLGAGAQSGDAWLMQLDLNATQTALAVLALESGDYQFGGPNTVLSAALGVHLADANGNRLELAGYPIAFTATNGATVSPALAYTDGGGITGTIVHLGNTDATVTATVSSTSVSYTFHVKAISSTLPASVAVASGNSQTGRAGAVLPSPLVVQLRDSTGAALSLAGITVVFQATNATVGSPTAVTDATGRASTTVTLGSQTGNATVQAAAGSLPAVTATFTVTASTASTVVITKVNVAGGGADAAQNTWIEIHGTGLAPAGASATWSGAPEFATGQMPTQLQGVSVKVNGKPAYVYFASPTQVNVLTPLDSTTGSVQLTLTNGAATSDPFTLNLRTAAPNFLLFGAGPYIAAVHADGTLLGPASLSSPGYTFTPAAPGETILLFGDGFGLPSSALAAGSMYQSGPLAALPQFTIGGAPAAVAFAGVISPGLYQFNVVVPASAANGDNAVLATYAGATTAAGAQIPVAR